MCRFWLELVAILNKMHLPEEKTVLLREDTCDTRIRPLTCDGQIYWKNITAFTCIFKPSKIFNFPPVRGSKGIFR